jgi:hypothetical protein
MSTLNVAVTSIAGSTGTWTNLTAAALNTVDASRASALPAATYTVEISDTVDLSSITSLDVTLNWRISAAANRAKSILVELVSGGVVVGAGQSTPTQATGATDRTDTLTFGDLSLTQAQFNALQIRCTNQEGSGMADSAQIQHDRISGVATGVLIPPSPADELVPGAETFSRASVASYTPYAAPVPVTEGTGIIAAGGALIGIGEIPAATVPVTEGTGTIAAGGALAGVGEVPPLTPLPDGPVGEPTISGNVFDWRPVPAGVTSQRIERRPAGGTWATIATFNDGTTYSYTDDEWLPDGTYEYRHVGINASGATASNVVTREVSGAPDPVYLGITANAGASSTARLIAAKRLGIVAGAAASASVGLVIAQRLGIVAGAAASGSAGLGVQKPLGISANAGAGSTVSLSVLRVLGISANAGAGSMAGMQVAKLLGIVAQATASATVDAQVSNLVLIGISAGAGASGSAGLRVGKLLGITTGAVASSTADIKLSNLILLGIDAGTAAGADAGLLVGKLLVVSAGAAASSTADLEVLRDIAETLLGINAGAGAFATAGIRVVKLLDAHAFLAANSGATLFIEPQAVDITDIPITIQSGSSRVGFVSGGSVLYPIIFGEDR